MPFIILIPFSEALSGNEHHSSEAGGPYGLLHFLAAVGVREGMQDLHKEKAREAAHSRWKIEQVRERKDFKKITIMWGVAG